MIPFHRSLHICVCVSICVCTYWTSPSNPSNVHTLLARIAFEIVISFICPKSAIQTIKLVWDSRSFVSARSHSFLDSSQHSIPPRIWPIYFLLFPSILHICNTILARSFITFSFETLSFLVRENVHYFTFDICTYRLCYFLAITRLPWNQSSAIKDGWELRTKCHEMFAKVEPFDFYSIKWGFRRFSLFDTIDWDVNRTLAVPRKNIFCRFFPKAYFPSISHYKVWFLMKNVTLCSQVMRVYFSFDGINTVDSNARQNGFLGYGDALAPWCLILCGPEAVNEFPR